MSHASGTQTTLHTSAEGLRTGRVDIPSFDQPIQAYYAAPGETREGGFPLVLVVQEIFGVNEHTQDICRRFAHQGYMAVAVELYQRQGDASSYDDNARLIKEIVSKVPDEQVMADLDAAVSWAGEQGANTERVGISGFCWGGRIVWMYAAHNPVCKAGVAWYGRLATGHGPLQVRNPVDVAGQLHGPVLGLYGGKDASIPLEDVRSMEGALAKGGEAAQASQIVVYPASGHAFFADYRPSYNPADAKDGWARCLAWFARYLA